MATTTDAKEDPDHLFKYDPTVDGQLRSQKVWSKDPSYFKKVKISATALVKMVMHALAGGDIEVMGLMVGRIEANTMIVMDSFALPVEGTETRVNAQSEGYEYASTYMTQMEQVGRPEKGIGWYHSHPGYGCWLSGIDVSTQMLQQKYSEPWLAVVIDPKRTAASGKVELGAFRTYPENYKPPDAGPSEYQSVPLDKIEDFGVHANSYYPLEVSYFKSSLDAHLLELLWTKYWVSTLAASPLLANRDFIAGQLKDISEKMDRAETQIAHGSKSSLGLMLPASSAAAKKDESQLAKLTKDSAKSTIDQVNGLMNQVLKELVFNVKPPRRR